MTAVESLSSLLLVDLRSALSRCTFSVALADTINGWTGIAATSSVTGAATTQAGGIVPGVAAYVVQSSLVDQRAFEVGRLLTLGTTAVEALRSLSSADFVSEDEFRQGGIAMTDGQAASYTRSSAFGFAGDVSGICDNYTYSIQGCRLTSEEVLASIEHTLCAEVACDLPDALMRMLEAGAARENAVNVAQVPNHVASLTAIDPYGRPVAELEGRASAPREAVSALRDVFNDWRVHHPCSRPLACAC